MAYGALYFRTPGFDVYSQIIFKTHIITSSEFIEGFIKVLLESFWIKCHTSESEVMSTYRQAHASRSSQGGSWGSDTGALSVQGPRARASAREAGAILG